MPRLILLAACDKVIIAQPGGELSLIVIINEIKVGLAANAPDPIPDNAALQMRWSVVTQWEPSEEEYGTTFEHRIELTTDTGVSTGLDTTAEFVPEAAKLLHTVVANFTFFPLLHTGLYRVQISTRRRGDREWNIVSNTPIRVVLEPAPVSVGEPA